MKETTQVLQTELRTATLPGGLRIVLENRPYAPCVSVGVWIGAGSMHETAEENGCAHFLEHMAFKSTENRTAGGILEEMDRLGGHINAFTEKECTCYYARVIPEHLGQLLDLFADLLLHPLTDRQEMEKERGVILEEIAMCEDNPEDRTGDLLSAAFFGGQPMGRPILGSAEGIRTMTRERLLGYRRAHYVPGSTVVALSGRMPDADAVLEAIAQAFAGWTGEAAAQAAPKRAAQLRRLCDESSFEQTHLSFAWPGPVLDAPETPAAWALSMILGEGNSSRLFRRIREEMGAVYNIYSDVVSYPSCGMVSVFAETSPQQAQKVLDTLGEELDRLLEGGVTAEEMDMAKEQLRIACLLGDESSEERMTALGRSLLLRGRIREKEEVLSAIDRVSPEEINSLLREIFAQPSASAFVGKGVKKLKIPGIIRTE
ncbi:MAG: insulinase family protein [Clostridia bacterium]|nr:insulinase family protein [Clostridia bacterium]